MKLYRTLDGIFVEEGGSFFTLSGADFWTSEWDDLLASDDLLERARKATEGAVIANFDIEDALSVAHSQEVWAAGVTYFRSRNARIEESKDAGGGDFYDRVYAAVRPELFFKANGRKVIGPGAGVRIRSDATWSVPEPELTLFINPKGEIAGYTIGNDMSSRDIEGENPLYLPQAKVYDGSCALGPCILLATRPMPRTTAISISISRGGSVVFEGSTTLAELKRDSKELAAFLFRDNSFPQGVFLMTGTGIVPDDDFTLESMDVVRISIEGIGVLENFVK
ncbi:fumarylacetoacetate hydrolase family protein [Granulicella arctica]|uniref:fumarylacetoacetate hydrolase family protein n=1 Tax=Granulicella arctica TaxID=940613 RepID=UPI0021DFD420|nr:fumarylacetoacetate hydrolase family protein [Granulicella arctica]